MNWQSLADLQTKDAESTLRAAATALEDQEESD